MNRLVVVSNRVPAPASPGAPGGSQAGGLAVALEGLMQKRGGMWFGWSGKVSDGAASQAVKVQLADNLAFATMDLTREEHDRYYRNYSNGLLWPLLHSMTELMHFDRNDARVYREVNSRMAGQLAPLLQPDDVIWVHDYHLLPLPALLRARGVQSPIGFFLHIPFPTHDVLASAPEATALIRDLLAADLIGFQTDRDLENFSDAAQSVAGAVSSADGWLQVAGRRVRLGVFPVEIEPKDFAATAERAVRSARSERLRRSLGNQKLIIGVDRLDPTKGLIQRIGGYRRLLETREGWSRNVTFLQIAAISRADVVAYQELRTQLDQEVGALNGEFGDPDWTPLRLVARAGARDVVAGYMRLARVGLVTPLRDGMNLVAKEYIAAQNSEDPGVLVLSRFAGAARQLESALLVNPHDPEDMAEAIDRALQMSQWERQERWQSQWRALADVSPLSWGRSFLAALLRATMANGARVSSQARAG